MSGLLGNGIKHSLRKGLELSILGPSGRHRGLLRRRSLFDGVLERDPDGGVGDTQNKGMITSIHVVVQQGGGFGIGTRHNNQVDAQDIRRETSRYQAINVFLRTDQNLATHVSTLFRSGLLIFQMHTGGSRFGHELGQLHDGRQASVSGITIRHNGLEVIPLDARILMGQKRLTAFLILPTIVVELGADQLIDLVGYRVHGVVRKVGAGLVGCAGGGRALPSRNINAAEVGTHLRDLDGIEGSKGVGVPSDGVEVGEERPELVGLLGAEGDAVGRQLVAGASFRRRSEASHVLGCAKV